MYESFKESKGAFLYLWFTKAKLTMGLFYVFFVVLYLFFGYMSEGPAITLDLLTSIEMIFACFFIGVAQQAFIPTDKLSRPRCIFWIISGTVITLGFSLFFGWFGHFPPWCFILFNILVPVGMGIMLISYYLELHQETKALNQQLLRFQGKASEMKREDH